MSIGETKHIGSVMVTRNRLGLCISDIVNNQWIHQTYVGYTQREAVRRFRQYRKEYLQG